MNNLLKFLSLVSILILSACSPDRPVIVTGGPAAVVCPSNEHAAFGVCVSNQRACVIANGTGQQAWNSSARQWDACVATSCNSGYNLNAGACVAIGPLVCPPGQHANGSVCENDIQSCAITNGQGQQTWNGSAYGACVAVLCQSGYDLINNSCLSQCGLSQHRNSATYACENNIIACAVVNGSGTQTWNGSAYGACTVSACDTNFHNESNACVSNTRACPMANGQGQEIWNGSGYNACQVYMCDTSYHEESNACVSDIRSCTVANGQGQETWTGSAYGVCTATACDSSYHLESNSCANDIQSCAIANGQGQQTWLGNQYSACTVQSCDNGYQIAGNACVVSNNGQNMAVDFTFFNYVNESDKIEVDPVVTNLGAATVTNVALTIKKVAPTAVDPYVPASGIRCTNETIDFPMINCQEASSQWIIFHLDDDVGTYEMTLAVTNSGGYTATQTKTIVNEANNDEIINSNIMANTAYGPWASAISQGTLVSIDFPQAALDQNIATGRALEYRYRVRAANKGSCRYPVNPPANNSINYFYTLNVDGTTPQFNYTFDTNLLPIQGSNCPNLTNGGEYNIQMRILDTEPTSRIVAFGGYRVHVNQGQTPMVDLDQMEFFMTVHNDPQKYWLTNWGNTLNAGEPLRFNFHNYSNGDGDNNYQVHLELDDDGQDDVVRNCSGDCTVELNPAINPQEYFQTKVGGGPCLDGDTCVPGSIPVRLKIVDSNGDLNYFWQQVDLGSSRRPIIINNGGGLFYSILPEQKVNGAAEITINPFSGGASATLDASEATNGFGGPCTGCLYTWDVNKYVILPGDTDFTYFDDGDEYVEGASPYFTWFYTQESENTLPYSTVRDGDNWAVAPTNLRVNPPITLPSFNTANLKLWLKADDLNTLDNGDSVAEWKDFSPNGKNFVQTDPLHQPVMNYMQLNGYPGVTFEGLSGEADGQFMQVLGLEDGTEAGVSIFVVARTINGGPEVKYPILSTRIGDIFASNPGFAFGFDYNTFGSNIGNSFDLLTQHTSGFTDFGKVNSIVDNNFYVAYMGMDGSPGSNEYYLGNVLQPAPYNYYGNSIGLPYVPSDSLTTGYLGLKTLGFWARNPDAGHKVQVFEVLYFKDKLSPADRDAVIDYLKTKYNL